MKLDRRSFLRGGIAIAAVGVVGMDISYSSHHAPIPTITHSGNMVYINADGCTSVELYEYMMDVLRCDDNYII